MNFAEVHEMFSNPGKEFRPAPLWVWNAEMTEADVDFMLPQFKKQGFGGFFIHPRPGMETEYLSERWFDLWRYSFDKGKELGLDAWIYDENSYPSGMAGGNVQDQMPESYNEGQGLLCRKDSIAPVKDSCYMCLLRSGDSFSDITDSLVKYSGRPGRYYIYTRVCGEAPPKQAGFPYVDLIKKGVTEKFIEITMPGYEKILGKELGTSVKGIFTDEPQIEQPAGTCRWTGDLFDVFRERWGYSLAESWPLLSENIGNWKKVRHDYNATLLQMFVERWSMPCYRYTEKHHLLWTGHYWEHCWPNLSLGPDNMAMYAWHQMPAIDMLFNQYNDKSTQAQFGNVRSVKELASVANQMGRVRTLSETYGAAGHEVSFTDLKRLGDWEYALGVNFMSQHLCHTTVTGIRKYDYPPEFTPISPWWDDYRILNDNFARLSLVLSQGEQRNNWLILEPTTTIWLYYTTGTWSPIPDRIADSFQQLITRLEKNQMEYDLGSEDIIKNFGTIDGDKFRVGQRSYSTVVIPPGVENLERTTFELLSRFEKSGGRIVTMSRPSYVDGEENDEIRSMFSSMEISDADSILALYRDESPLKSFTATGSQLYHHHRVYNDGDLYFFVNSSLDEDAEFSFAPVNTGYLYRLDPMSGSTVLLSDVSVNTLLPPSGSVLYFASSRPVLGLMSELSGSVSDEILRGTRSDTVPEGNLEVKRLKDNILNLDFCSLSVDGDVTSDIYVKKANSLLWNRFGGRDPWEQAVQLKTKILDGDTISNGKVSVEYRFSLDSGVDLNSMHMIVERPDIWTVSVNGKVLPYEKDTILDSRCGLFDISSAVSTGVNSVVIYRGRMSIHAEIAPVMILGNFDVQSSDPGWKIVPSSMMGAGNWSGCPEYPWGVSYSRKYSIAEPEGRYHLKLGKWSGTDSQVWVNGKKIGNISFPPYELDITHHISRGDNSIEVRVMGSLKNLYGPHYAPPTGLAGPGSWNGVEKQRSGKDYDLIQYGLDNFHLLNCR